MFFFFFFQAEDGIRDADVTGVQTCALPISTIMNLLRVFLFKEQLYNIKSSRDIALEYQREGVEIINRSEERRVGKECRSRWSPYHEKKKKKKKIGVVTKL